MVADSLFCHCLILVEGSGKDKDDVHSRAYISFKTMEGLIAFSKGYDGWSFRDKSGRVHFTLRRFRYKSD